MRTPPPVARNPNRCVLVPREIGRINPRTDEGVLLVRQLCSCATGASTGLSSRRRDLEPLIFCPRGADTELTLEACLMPANARLTRRSRARDARLTAT